MALVVQHPKISGQSKVIQSRETPVGESQVIQNIKHDSQSLQLTVTMKNGAQYLYSNVYPQVYEDFVQSKSKGRFFSEVIKGKYPSDRSINKNTGPSAKRKNAIQ